MIKASKTPQIQTGIKTLPEVQSKQRIGWRGPMSLSTTWRTKCGGAVAGIWLRADGEHTGSALIRADGSALERSGVPSSVSRCEHTPPTAEHQSVSPLLSSQQRLPWETRLRVTAGGPAPGDMFESKRVGWLQNNRTGLLPVRFCLGGVRRKISLNLFKAIKRRNISLGRRASNHTNAAVKTCLLTLPCQLSVFFGFLFYLFTRTEQHTRVPGRGDGRFPVIPFLCSCALIHAWMEEQSCAQRREPRAEGIRGSC